MRGLAHPPERGWRADPRPFSQAIMEESIPPHFVMPKMPPFSGIEDPETHRKAFQAQMMITGAQMWLSSRCCRSLSPE